MAVDILDLDRDALGRELEATFQTEPYRVRQIFPWIYRERSRSFAEMSNIKQELREKLGQAFYVSRPSLATVEQSIDGTRKYLFELEDGAFVETVLIKQPKRLTLCVSSQVGCAIGCKFCRTALMGLKRHLRAGEIVGQVLAVKDDILANAESKPEVGPTDFSNIVFMGMGEPLHNAQNVITAVNILNDDFGLNFAGRKITVSTSGVIPGIKTFTDERVDARLAVSLNATNDEQRSALIPINKKWPLEQLLNALRTYTDISGHPVTMEYVMLHGVNDTEADLRRLPKLLAGIPVKINLIPYNENAKLGFNAPPRTTIDLWQRELAGKGFNTRIRWSKGEDISAACGQLATASGRKNGKKSN